MILEILLLGLGVSVRSLRGYFGGCPGEAHQAGTHAADFFAGMLFALGAWQAITAWWR